MSPEPIKVGYLVKRYPRLSETFILTEILELERRGVDVTVLALKWPPEARFHEKLSRVRGEVVYAPEVRSNTMLGFLRRRLADIEGLEPEISSMFWSALRKDDATDLESLLPAIAFLGTIREKGIQHLHAHFATKATSVAMRLARLARIGYSVTAHAKDIFHESVDADDFSEKVLQSDFTVAVSDWSAEYISTTHGPRVGSKVTRIYNGLDLTEFPDAPPLTERSPLIASIGRLVPKKGLDILIDALAILRDTGRPVACEIIGDGELRDALQDRITSLRLGDLVQMRGAASHDAVRSLLHRAALFVLPARVADDGNRDGLPVVVVEAMASGVPVVSTPVVGIPEAVIDGDTGMLVPQDDAVATAEAITRLLDDPTLAGRLATNARRLVRERFDVTRSAATLDDRFRGAVAARTGHSPVAHRDVVGSRG